MDYVVIKLINWQYSAGNTPDMQIDRDSTSRPMELDEAVARMNAQNLRVGDTPYAWAVMPVDAYKHLVKTGMYKSEIPKGNKNA